MSSEVKVTWTTTEHHEAKVDADEWAALDDETRDSFLADLEGNDTFQWCERDDGEVEDE